MRWWHLAGVLPAALLAAGCGGSSGSGSSAGSTRSRLTDESQHIVLQHSDLGPGYAFVPASSKPQTLSGELKNETARARAADRRSWLGGYTATFARQGSIVISIAANYRNASDASVSFADPTGIRSFDTSFHAHAVKTPSGAPGTGGSMRVGRVTIQGRPVAVRAYIWQHGRAIGAVVVVGSGDSPLNVLRLARKEDARMANLIAAGLV
jgi:hypothetical protein